jgi:hypothetical protein
MEQKRDFDLLYEACEQSGVDLEPPRKVFRAEPSGDARDFSPVRKVVTASLPRDLTSEYLLAPVTPEKSPPPPPPANYHFHPIKQQRCLHPLHVVSHPTVMYSATDITTTPDNRIIIESPHSTFAIVNYVETTDILKLSARSEFTAYCRLPDGSKYTCTSSIVAKPTNPTPPEKTDAAIQGDIIDFQQFQNENDGHVQILVLFLNNSYGVVFLY